MAPITPARVRRKLATSRPGAILRPGIRAGRRLLEGWDRIGQTRIVSCLPAFTTDSAASRRQKADVTIDAASQTLPLMVNLVRRTGGHIQAPVDIASLADGADRLLAAGGLEKLFNHYGSDKSIHGYHILYGAILAQRTSVKAVLEIGIGTNNVDVLSNMGRSGQPGASLRAFRDFLPDATVYGADIDRRILFSEERISTFWADQTDAVSLAAIADVIGGGLDLIIDDGLHSPHANLRTLNFALHTLKIGGYVVIEDIRPAAMPVWQVVVALMPHEYECQIVAAKTALLFVGRRTALADGEGCGESWRVESEARRHLEATCEAGKDGSR